jgi:GNAT superfamily N-acetyltransferase
MSDAHRDDAITDLIVHSRLQDGTPVCIRSVRPTDEARMREGIEHLSARSKYLRFFSVQPMPPDAVIERLIDVDGHRHIAWGAIHSGDPAHPAIGAVHAMRTGAQERTAEFSVAIVDAFHGLGLARMLIAVLLVNCRHEGIASLDVQVLSENKAAGHLVRSLGGVRRGVEFSVTEYTLDTGQALDRLRRDDSVPGLADVFAALADYL